MKNVHERFGKLVCRRRTEKTATNIRVFLDACGDIANGDGARTGVLDSLMINKGFV